MFMAMAWTAAMRGTCNRLKVGAIVVRDNRPISLGYNGTLPGHPHCGPECNANNPCTKTQHAEANAILWASNADGTTIYITDSPCLPCAKRIYNAGVKRVVYDRAYRNTEGLEFLKQQKVEVKQCHVKLVISAN